MTSKNGDLTWREFRSATSSKSAPNIWMIAQDGNKYFTRHGMLGGALQEFSDAPGDKGKPGTKAYVNETDNTVFHMEREIRKKTEHGYIEYVDGKPSQEAVTEIVWAKCLPKNFCSYKPKTDIDHDSLVKIHKAGNARYTRKYDGMMHLAVHHPWGWEIYTRRMDLASDRFPNHIEILNQLTFDVGTVIVGEMLCARENGTDDFKAISRICRSDPPEARKLIETKECPEPYYQIFDIVFHNERNLSDWSYDERRKLWGNLDAQGLVRPVSLHNVTPETWEQAAKENGWEGFVVTDGSAKPGKNFISFDGKPKRPKGHHKLKPIFEDDVIIYAGTAGTGKRANTIGALFVKQIHPETKQYFACGKVGSGLSDESISELEILFKKHNLPILEKDKDVEKIDIQNSNGLVCQIEFGERQPGTNKFRFPVYIRLRDDKDAEECIAQRLSSEVDSDEDED